MLDFHVLGKEFKVTDVVSVSSKIHHHHHHHHHHNSLHKQASTLLLQQQLGTVLFVHRVYV
jgi:hypothetical protein